MQTLEVDRTAAPSQTAASPAEEYRSVPLAILAESRSNPRRTFNQTDLEELAASIRQKGVLQPLLVRPLTALQQITRKEEEAQFEIVFGARRFRASKLAGLAEVPVRIRALNDKEALEVQVIENLQRKDLDALEEADGYQLLHQKHGYSIDDLAVKVGKSARWVYARLQLTKLTKPARVAFADGKLSPSTALLVARIPTSLQDKAVKGIVHGEHGNASEPMSYREASAYVQREFMLRLAGAPFKIDDPELVAAAGACSTCPKRTGNQRELFDDVTSADVCTDPTCFNQKRDAAWAIKRREAETGGQKILSDAEAKKAFSPYGDGIDWNASYVDLARPCYQDAKSRPYRDLIGDVARRDNQVVLARDPKTAAVHELVPKAAVNKLLKAAGHRFGQERASATRTSSGNGTAADRGRQEKDRQARELAARVKAAALAQAAAGVEKRELRDDDLRFLVGLLLAGAMDSDHGSEAFEAMAVRRHVLKAPTGQQYPRQAEKAVRAALPKTKGAQLRGLLIEVALCSLDSYDLGGSRPKLATALQAYGVDLKKVEASVRAQVDVERAAKKQKTVPAKRPARAHASA